MKDWVIVDVQDDYLSTCAYPPTGYAKGMEKRLEEQLAEVSNQWRFGCSRTEDTALFSASPTHTPTSPNLRWKGAGKGKVMPVEGDGDVGMLDGDENLRKFDFA